MASRPTVQSLARQPAKFLKDCDGAVAAIFAISLTVLLGFLALVTDLGYAFYMDNRVQVAADSSALAGVSQLADANDDGVPDNQAYTEAAIEYAYENMAEAGHGTIIDPACGTYNAGARTVSGASDCDDVKAGNWDLARPRANAFIGWDDPVFDSSTMSLNAVRVRTHREQATGNPVPTFFATLFGLNLFNINGTAIAEGTDSNAAETRFLIDDEMLDTDVLSIEDLAEDLGVTSDDLLADADGDWFIDLPPGTIIELPTGQVGDEALFELVDGYPMGTTGYPSHADFLNWNEDSNSWRYDLVPKEMLDPLVGVEEVNNADYYWDYIDDAVQVSPVYKSDTSALNDYNGMPAVNALGWRRGLLAFRILGLCMAPGQPGYSQNYVGPGYSCTPEYAPPPPSYLPNMVIEVVDPVYVGSLNNVTALSVGEKFWLVD